MEFFNPLTQYYFEVAGKKKCTKGQDDGAYLLEEKFKNASFGGNVLLLGADFFSSRIM